MNKVKGKIRQVIISAVCPYCKKVNTNSFADYDEVPIQKESNCEHWRITNVDKEILTPKIVYGFEKEAK